MQIGVTGRRAYFFISIVSCDCEKRQELFPYPFGNQTMLFLRGRSHRLSWLLYHPFTS